MSGDASSTMVEAVLTALYLRGAPRMGVVHRTSAGAAAYVLRAEQPTLESAHSTLRSNGFWAEATALQTPGLLDWAVQRVEKGEVLTLASKAYPMRWLARLGSQAPPALWLSGPMPTAPFLGAVGSRMLRPESGRFARTLGTVCASMGYGLASGGAEGADRLAAQGAQSAGSPVVEILPFGIARMHSGCHGSARLSVAAPNSPFSAPQAMERNALIYALSEATIVVQARFREGGTWVGAVDAIRRRLTRVVVRDDPADRASRALIALGATPLSEAASIPAVLNRSDAQRVLPHVLESRTAYAA